MVITQELHGFCMLMAWLSHGCPTAALSSIRDEAKRRSMAIVLLTDIPEGRG
jgi:hypothetical protein